MTVRPDPIARLEGPSAVARRAGNMALAAARFGSTWTAGVPSASWHRAVRAWPAAAGGLVLLVLAALAVDAPSVAWARALPDPVRDFFEWLTHYGESGWLLYSSATICIVLLMPDWRSTSRRVAAAWTEIGIIAGFAFVSIASSGILSNVIKQLVGRARPSVFDREGAFGFLPFQFDYAHASFPSGHATTMGALAVIVAVTLPRLAAPALAFCGLVAVSRIIVGAHYPSDVIGGLLLGAGFTWFYALALAEAGIGFARDPAGTIRARVVAIRRVFWRPRGVPIAVTGLWSAIVGSNSRTGSI